MLSVRADEDYVNLNVGIMCKEVKRKCKLLCGFLLYDRDYNAHLVYLYISSAFYHKL